MQNKVLMILCDGMRPDAVAECAHPLVEKLMSTAHYNPYAQTVFPSWTLPCHMSLFHGVTPEEHGVLNNTFVPGKRYGLFEHLRVHNKISSFFFSWGELKDLFAPSSVDYSGYISEETFGGKNAQEMLAKHAATNIADAKPDFIFLYLNNTDTVGHSSGWCSKEYIEATAHSFGLIENVLSKLPDDYSVIILADHGGHEHTHGTAEPCDMTIPLFIRTRMKIHEENFENANIIDISPTVCSLLGIPSAPEWKGKSLVE